MAVIVVAGYFLAVHLIETPSISNENGYDRYSVRNRKYNLDRERIGSGPGVLLTTVVDQNDKEHPVSLVVWPSGDPPGTGVKFSSSSNRPTAVTIDGRRYPLLYPGKIALISNGGSIQIIDFSWEVNDSSELSEDILERLRDLIGSDTSE